MKNKFIIKATIVLVIMIMCMMLTIIPSNASDSYYVQSQGGEVSSNVEDNNYGRGMTGEIVYSNLQELKV